MHMHACACLHIKLACESILLKLEIVLLANLRIFCVTARMLRWCSGQLGIISERSCGNMAWLRFPGSRVSLLSLRERIHS